MHTWYTTGVSKNVCDTLNKPGWNQRKHEGCALLAICDGNPSVDYLHKGSVTWKASWVPSQYPKIRLIVRSREVSKPRDLYLEFSDRSEIWQALQQHCCRCACQISKRYANSKYQSRGFDTSRDLTIRRLFGYWDGAQMSWRHHATNHIGSKSPESYPKVTWNMPHFIWWVLSMISMTWYGEVIIWYVVYHQAPSKMFSSESVPYMIWTL